MKPISFKLSRKANRFAILFLALWIYGISIADAQDIQKRISGQYENTNLEYVISDLQKKYKSYLSKMDSHLKKLQAPSLF